jgi:hypothetical protein
LIKGSKDFVCRILMEQTNPWSPFKDSFAAKAGAAGTGDGPSQRGVAAREDVDRDRQHVRSPVSEGCRQ